MDYKKQELIEKINALKSRDKLNYHALQEINRQIDSAKNIPLNMVIETIKHLENQRSIKLQELDNIIKSIVEEYQKEIENAKKEKEQEKQDEEQKAKATEEQNNKKKDEEVKSKIKQELDEDDTSEKDSGFDFDEDDF